MDDDPARSVDPSDSRERLRVLANELNKALWRTEVLLLVGVVVFMFLAFYQ
jgi:hypothetical protein